MTFPYNLRKTSRDLDMSQPRIAYPPSSYSSSSSSSCSSSQSSQSPSPVNRLGNYVRMPASSVLFSHQLDFEGFHSDDLSETSNDSDASNDVEPANHTVIDTNRTIIEQERIISVNEPLPFTRSKSKNFDAETSYQTTTSTIGTKTDRQEEYVEGSLASYQATSEHKSRSNKFKATNNSMSPPISSGKTTSSTATSTIMTRSANRSTSTNTRSSIVDNENSTRALTRSSVKSKLASAIPLSTKALEANGGSQLITRSRTPAGTGLEIVKNNVSTASATKNSSKIAPVPSSEKILRKKRISPNTNSQYFIDNDHDEDSSDDHRSSNQIVKIATSASSESSKSMTTRSSSTNRVSFQISESVEPVKQGKRTGRTPPHKKFRKLRLYDTPQTPKTLLKKAQPILDSDTGPVAPVSLKTAKKQHTKKLLTANEVIKAVVKGSPVVQKTIPKRPNALQLPPQVIKAISKPTLTPVTKHSIPITKQLPSSKPVVNESKSPLPQPNILPKTVTQQQQQQTPTKTTSNSILTTTDQLDSSPPHNQNFKLTTIYSEIHEAVHNTPKSVRRTSLTPGTNLLKAPMAMKNNSSPELIPPTTSSMDCNANQPQQAHTAISSRIDITNSAHARKLFDFNSNGSDMSSIMVQSNMNKKLQFDDSDNEDTISVPPQPKSLIFDNEDSSSNVGAGGSVSPVSSTSSWCSGANTQHMPYHLAKIKALSSSSNSLFKPISRFINNHHAPMGFNTSLSTALSSSSAAGLNSMRSPNSPFQFNQLHANINPFTPTNNSNSTVISNINHTNLVSNNNLSMPDINTITKENKLYPSTIKRCLNSDTPTSSGSSSLLERHGSNETETDIEMDYNSNSTDHHIDLNSATNSNNNNSSVIDHTQSVPRTNKRLALRQCLVSRYHEEFHEVCKLGNGEFGDVFKCINRLDGCTYAIKRSKKPIAGSALEVAAWKEVCAHAVLVKHSHIVQYYSAWAEADRMLIQNEYCNGGSLAEFIETQRTNNFNQNNQYNSPSQQQSSSKSMSLMSEYDLKLLLLHISKGLAYMHSLNLVHLDIKPGNIFICRTPKKQHVNGIETQIGTESGRVGVSQCSSNQQGLVLNEESGIESEGFDDDDDDACALTISNKTKQSMVNMDGLSGSSSNFSIFTDAITYKIGDMGHVTSTLDASVEEGDCRYLPNEILQEQYDYLPKADVFALALTVFVCATLEELPKNGDEWHWIRQGNLKDIPQCSERFKKLLTQMVGENPVNRPSASTLIHHPCIVPDASKSKSQLRKELNQEKFKNEMLKRKVKIYEQQLSGVTGNNNNRNVENTLIQQEVTQTTTLFNGNLRNVMQSSSKFSRSMSSTLL